MNFTASPKIVFFLTPSPLRFHASRLTQREAKEFCEEQEVPARLIEIDSTEENSAISIHLNQHDFGMAFWLGITDRHSEGHWVYESTGKSVVFTSWYSEEPNNANRGEDCAHIDNWRSKWNDVACDMRLGALCEM